MAYHFQWQYSILGKQIPIDNEVPDITGKWLVLHSLSLRQLCPGSTTSGLTICNRVQREGAVGTEGEAESEGPAGEGEVHHISGQVSTRRLEISAGNSSHKLLHS